MGSSRRSAPVAASSSAKERHKKAQRMLFDHKAPLPAGLVAKPTVPKLKHKTYFEIMENKDKKKKLEFKITTDKNPPPGFDFVPTGNPQLTTACKELSREKDAMIFIVSNLKDTSSSSLSHQVHRIGHHIRQSIVEEAKAQLDVFPVDLSVPTGVPEPIPQSQTQYNTQVDAAIRDLFPRIPNTDRQIIIEHAFDLSAKSRKGEKPVGLSADVTLARRVQLAVLAHIRHVHTRYDDLRKETTWVNARRVVEPLCLDILVKWRGDEETGRDQLDEILQEVVVISDSEDDEEEDDDDADVSSSLSDSSVEIVPPPEVGVISSGLRKQPGPTVGMQSQPHRHARTMKDAQAPPHARASGKKEQRGFKRYRAWQEAIQRNRAGHQQLAAHPASGSASHGNQPHTDGGQPSSPARHLVPESRFGEPTERRDEDAVHPSRPFLIGTHEAEASASRPNPVFREGPSSGNTPFTDTGHFPPPQRASPPLQDRFKDLLVRSIEPASPSATQPYLAGDVPSFSPGPGSYARLPPYSVSNPQVDAMPAYRTAAGIHDPPHGRVISDQSLQSSQFPGGFIQVSRRVASGSQRPHSQRPIPISRHDFGEPLLPQVRTRPRETEFVRDDRPAKRTFQEPPHAARRHDDFYMEDMGGFLQKVPLHPDGSRSVPPDPGFIEIRRAAPSYVEADRVVSREEGHRLREEPGVEVIPISSSPLQPLDRPTYNDPQLAYHTLDHTSAFGQPPGIAFDRLEPQPVFRHVRQSRPRAYHQTPYDPHDEHRLYYPDEPLGHAPPHLTGRTQDPGYRYRPEDRRLGRHSHSPIVLE
ncbi:hypothetical protein LIA77_03302 [Sarocladium implicatum]|nr:hypothetical protein LIA77_03302 [Sarocladium implicatum]